MQFTGVRNRRTPVVADLHRTRIAGVPSPGEAQFPSAAMAAKERAEGAELKPAQVKLRCEFLCGDETADVCPPVRDAGQRGIDGDGNVDLESVPRGVDIARPEERGVALHASVAVTVERIRALVGTVELWAFPVHPVPRQSRRDIQRIAFVGPPAVHSHREILAVYIP